jgi:hypothetical protein
VLLGLVWILGIQRGWSQSSGSLSNNSESDLRTWDELSQQFRTALNGQSERLLHALTLLEISKANSRELTGLLGASLKANENLRHYNEQIAERMQENDEALAAAYEDINRLEKQRLRLIIALGIFAASAVAVLVVINLKKF